MKSALENLPQRELLQLVLKKDEQIEHLSFQNEKLESQKERLELQKERLEFQLEQLKRMMFGSKRERFEADPNQIKIEFEEYAIEAEKQDESPVKQTITYQRNKSTSHTGRNSIPAHLPVVEHTIEPSEDTSAMKRIGEERTEILEYVPEKFFKLVLIRPKYARVESDSNAIESTQKSVVIAELPSRPIEKCLAGNRLLAAILVHKYIDHLPLYRQQQIFKRAAIEIAPSTIDSWVAQLGRLLEVLHEKLITEIKAQQYLQADETTIKVLDKNQKKETHLGYFWVYHAPLSRLVTFDYQKGRGKNAPRSFLQGYKGTLQTDGYAVYKHYYNNKEVTHLACWAHVRRKFEKALQSNRSLAEHVLTEIQKLDAIEREIRVLTASERKTIRLEKSLPIINGLGKWLYVQKQVVLPKSPFGQALEYTIPLWESLQNYLHDGNLHNDNNLIENTIRPVALGRKNYLFAGSHEGARRSAMFYSFFACCKINNLNPQKWLEYVLSVIADCPVNQLHNLLPNNIDPAIIENHTHFWEV